MFGELFCNRGHAGLSRFVPSKGLHTLNEQWGRGEAPVKAQLKCPDSGAPYRAFTLNGTERFSQVTTTLPLLSAVIINCSENALAGFAFTVTRRASMASL